MFHHEFNVHANKEHPLVGTDIQSWNPAQNQNSQRSVLTITLTGCNVADVVPLNKLLGVTLSVFIDFEMIDFHGLSYGAQLTVMSHTVAKHITKLEAF